MMNTETENEDDCYREWDWVSTDVHDTHSAYIVNRSLVTNQLKPSKLMAMIRHNMIPIPNRSDRRCACTGRIDRGPDVAIRIF